MFLTIKEGYKKDRIYRDARNYVYICEILIFGLLILSGFQPGRTFDDMVPIVLFLLLAGFVGYKAINHLFHGSITLDGRGRVLEFSKSWDLDIPSFTVQRENIDQVKVRHIKGVRRAPGGSARSRKKYVLNLCIKSGNQYKEKPLILMLNFDDCCRVASLIGKFANKPAFDDEGKQIFTPKN